MPKRVSPNTVVATALTAAALTLTITIFTPPTASALPVYAARTGLPCGRCHVDPAGGGPRTAFGRAFARNGHHLPGRGRSPRRGPNDHPGYDGYNRYDTGPGMMGGYGGMGPGMMGGYGR